MTTLHTGYNRVMSKSIGETLLAWYRENARELPWRDADDPYLVLVSEIMLQQTRVETVRTYYQRWLERFPSLEDLAESPLEDVLQIWEGLGYYRRAHNLHAAARQIQERFNGQIPDDPSLLRELPGVGEYTASAVSAFAFHHDLVALDGNLKRVLARLGAVEDPIDRPAVQRRLKELARKIMPSGRASEFNQALMDLGSSICVAGVPRCQECPLHTTCLAYQRGIQSGLPVRNIRSSIPHVSRVGVVVEKGAKLLVAKRPADAMLASLWEFPRFEVESAKKPPDSRITSWTRENMGMEIETSQEIGEFAHAYSHFRVTEWAFRSSWKVGRPRSSWHAELRWVDEEELDALPMGKLARMISQAWSALEP